MGAITSVVKRYWYCEKHQIYMVDTVSSGCRHIFHGLKLGDYQHIIPNIGFAVERTDYKSLEISFLPEPPKLREQWMVSASGIIFVVDSADRSHLESAKSELRSLLEMKNCPLVVFANKQDLSGALSPEAVADILELENITDRQWHVVGTCGVTGEGVPEGLDWLDGVVQN